MRSLGMNLIIEKIGNQRETIILKEKGRE